VKPTNEIWDNFYYYRGKIPLICCNAARKHGYSMRKLRGKVWLYKEGTPVEWFISWKRAYDYMYNLVHKEVV
jgi:hypothetical protein